MWKKHEDGHFLDLETFFFASSESHTLELWYMLVIVDLRVGAFPALGAGQGMVTAEVAIERADDHHTSERVVNGELIVCGVRSAPRTAHSEACFGSCGF